MAALGDRQKYVLLNAEDTEIEQTRYRPYNHIHHKISIDNDEQCFTFKCKYNQESKINYILGKSTQLYAVHKLNYLFYLWNRNASNLCNLLFQIFLFGILL